MYKWNREAAIKVLGYFYEVEHRIGNYSEGNTIVRFAEVSLYMDLLIDRYELDVADIEPTTTGRSPSSLLSSINKMINNRDIKCLL